MTDVNSTYIFLMDCAVFSCTLLSGHNKLTSYRPQKTSFKFGAFLRELLKTTTGPAPPKKRDLTRENAWLRTSRGQQMVKKKGSVLSTPSTADHQTPTIHTGRSIYHMTKLSHKHFVLGCTSSDSAQIFPPLEEASEALRGNTALPRSAKSG